MDHRHTSPARPRSPRPRTHRERSNSLPIVEALGCSTPEARLLLAEGRAAVHRRRAVSQRTASIPQDSDTSPVHHFTSSKPTPLEQTTFKPATYNPRDHLAFLHGPAPTTTLAKRTLSSTSHTRFPSDATDSSTSTIVTVPVRTESAPEKPPSPLNNYSANLAEFIKAQLNSIPTFAHIKSSTSPISPRSCPDLTFSIQTPPQSPTQSTPRIRGPSIIEIPPIRPPIISQFSAWSSVGDDEIEHDSSLFPEGLTGSGTLSGDSSQTTSFFGYYQNSNNTSFFLGVTPGVDEKEADIMSDTTPSILSTVPGLSPETTLSTSAVSYFDCKRPTAISPELRDRVVAAVTPPVIHGKTLMATSPWEGAPLANIHDVVVESQHRVHVDGLSFDMQRDFVLPSHIGTPC